MKAILVAAHGGPEQLMYQEVLEPQPGPGQVLIGTTLTSLNFADIQARRGGYEAGSALPFTPGLDVVGVVEALGEGVEGLRLGQRQGDWGLVGADVSDVWSGPTRRVAGAGFGRSQRG